MKTSAEILSSFAVNPVPTRDWAIARARVVQTEIDRYRKQLCAPHSSNNTAAYMAMLASYDREMDRLCSVPGVLTVLLAETVGDNKVTQ